MKLLDCCFILITTVTVLGCVSQKISVTKTGVFDPTSTITVVSSGRDPEGVTGKLEGILLSRGFKVVSESVAENLAKTNGQIEINQNDISYNQTKQNIKLIKSVYALKYQYDYIIGIGSNYFKYFNASIIDLSTGQLCASIRHSSSELGGKRIDKVLEEFVDNLTK